MTFLFLLENHYSHKAALDRRRDRVDQPAGIVFATGVVAGEVGRAVGHLVTMTAVVQHQQVARTGRGEVRFERLLDAPGGRLAILQVGDLRHRDALGAEELDQRGVAAVFFWEWLDYGTILDFALKSLPSRGLGVETAKTTDYASHIRWSSLC